MELDIQHFMNLIRVPSLVLSLIFVFVPKIQINKRQEQRLFQHSKSEYSIRIKIIEQGYRLSVHKFFDRLLLVEVMTGVEPHLYLLFLVVDHYKCLVLACVFQVVSQVFVLLIVLIHHALVARESKPKVMAVC